LTEHLPMSIDRLLKRARNYRKESLSKAIIHDPLSVRKSIRTDHHLPVSMSHSLMVTVDKGGRGDIQNRWNK